MPKVLSKFREFIQTCAKNNAYEEAINQLRNITAVLVLLLWSCTALAAATVLKVQGDVQMTPAQGEPGKLAPGQRVETGAIIKTGVGGEISLRFDDGQLLSLSPDTSFIINEYKFNPHKPEESSFTGSLLKGGLRAVAGIIGEKNRDNVKFKVEVATVAIRGADFALHYSRELYLAVQEGTVIAMNAGGEEVFDAKLRPYGVVANAQTKPQYIMKEQLPAATQSTILVLQTHPLSDTIRKPMQKHPSCIENNISLLK